MIENHEILCPTFINCSICQRKRQIENIERIEKFFSMDEDITLLSKHFYKLTISVKPLRENYHNFTLEPLKKVGRALINGLSSISSVSNRKWWSLFIDSGIRYFSIEQEDITDYPTFNQHFIFYSEKDNLDTRLNIQLKYRLRKISRLFDYKLEYLGVYNLDKIINSINLDINVDFDSIPMSKLGEDVKLDIIKMKEQKPIIFGNKYNNIKTEKIQILTS